MKQKKAPYLYVAGALLFLLPLEWACFHPGLALAQNQPSRAAASAAKARSTNSDSAPIGDALRSSENDKTIPAPRAATSTDKVQVTGLRFLSWKSYTRIMLDLSQEAKYEVRRLKMDPAKGLPPRIYVDIIGARLALTSKEPVPVEDGLLRQVRLGQYGADIVRVVLDMNSLRDHKTFLLADPYRLVIDVYGQRPEESAAVKEVARTSTTD